MDTIPIELYDYIFDLKYKLEYCAVIRELQSYFPSNDYYDFYYPFKNTIIIHDEIITHYESDTDLIEFINVLDYVILN